MNSPIQLYAGGTLTATTNGAAIQPTVKDPNFDSTGAPWQVSIPVTIGAAGGAGTYGFKLQDSPDGVNWTDRSANRLASDDGGPAANNATGTVTLDATLKNPANVRLVVTVGGTTPSITVAAVTMQPLFAMCVEGNVISTDGITAYMQLSPGFTEENEQVFRGTSAWPTDTKFSPLQPGAAAILGQGQNFMILVARALS